MIFVDEARIFVAAGAGGKGCESFHKGKYHRYRRPDGGDGGKGGDVLLKTDPNVQTLLDFKYKQHYKAAKGGNAGSRGKTGRRGENCVLRVPVGTIIRDLDTKLLIKDLAREGQEIIVARGGKGGLGNANNKTPTPPQPGEERTITLELKLVADVGIIGFPNAGKSTFISTVSKVKSKVANYPFTTKQPILGFIPGETTDFIMADLPGIIEGAHEGKGLGHRFLRHAERTKILMHMVDMAGTDARDPLEDYATLNREIQAYGKTLSGKKRILVANKMDLPEAKENLTRFRKKYKEKIYPISLQKKEGMEEVLVKIREMLCCENSPDPSNASSSK